MFFSLTGTCFSPPECQSKTGGFADGSCADGFGTCCVILLSECGGSIGENSTHFSSPDYPKVYQTAATCTYTLNKVDIEICFIRLEFINFVIDGPVSNTSPPNQNWDCVNDNVINELYPAEAYSWYSQLVFTTPVSKAPPTICGYNTGQHLYMDATAGLDESSKMVLTTTGK